MAARTHVARFKAQGSAREGLAPWKLQRLTAIATAILALWLIVSCVSLSGAGYAEVRAWLARPFDTTMMILLVVSAFWHAQLGLQEVILDYVHHEGAKLASLVVLGFVIVALGVASIVAILEVSLGS
jgi:succinate dehydrogenase / fumarate reductase membrane anchor subunit